MALRNSLRPFTSVFDAPFFARQAAPASFFGGSSLWQPPTALFNELAREAPAFPAVSVEEKDAGYEITADIPSFEKGDVKVHLADANRRLILEGEAKKIERLSPPAAEESTSASEQQGAPAAQGAEGETAVAKTQSAGSEVAQPSPAYLINERSTYSSFRRAFHFNTPLNPKSIKARLENGQLKVSVEKASEDEGIHSVIVE